MMDTEVITFNSLFDTMCQIILLSYFSSQHSPLQKLTPHDSIRTYILPLRIHFIETPYKKGFSQRLKLRFPFFLEKRVTQCNLYNTARDYIYNVEILRGKCVLIWMEVIRAQIEPTLYMKIIQHKPTPAGITTLKPNTLQLRLLLSATSVAYYWPEQCTGIAQAQARCLLEELSVVDEILMIFLI